MLQPSGDTSLSLILTLHIHESFSPRDAFIPSRQGEGGISRFAEEISYMYTETGGISCLVGTYSKLLRMRITHEYDLHSKMDGKEQFGHGNIDRE